MRNSDREFRMAIMPEVRVPKAPSSPGNHMRFKSSGLAAVGCRLLYKRLQFGARRRLVDDLLPAIVIHLRELT